MPVIYPTPPLFPRFHLPIPSWTPGVGPWLLFNSDGRMAQVNVIFMLLEPDSFAHFPVIDWFSPENSAWKNADKTWAYAEEGTPGVTFFERSAVNLHE